jgi:hypothetical protein
VRGAGEMTFVAQGDKGVEPESVQHVITICYNYLHV